MRGMILAAGLGTRLKPFTDKHPKALAIVNGKTLLQRNIEYLQQYEINEVLVNVHHFADQIINTIQKNNGWGSNITISDETDAVLETGGGLQKASWYFERETDFVLMNVDVLTDLHLNDMIKAHESNTCLATLAVTERNSSRYFLFDENNYLAGWKNNKTGEEKIVRSANNLSPKAFSGIHVISSKIFSLINQAGKFSIVDVYLNLAGTYNIQCFSHNGNMFIDVGKPENLIKAETIFKP